MKTTLIATLAVAALSAPALAGGVGYINEFHYDNSGGDTNEFIEITLAAGENPADWDLHLYNGSDQQYYTDSGTAGTDIFNGLDLTFHGTFGGFDYYTILPPSIQNGSPDGIGLTYQGVPVEFLSYEGDFTASGGALDGVMSVDIGVTQGSGTSIGSSLQRNTVGGSDWTPTDGVNTFGAVNVVPAPGALAILGLAGIAARRRRA